MPSHKPGQTERTENHAGLPIRTKRRTEALASGQGIGVTGEKKKPADAKLPLKNSGDGRKVRIARGWEDHVRALLEECPKHFQALRSLIEGRPEEVTERQLRDLRAWGYLAPDLSPLPGVISTVQAAYRETPDGPVIVDSLAVKTKEDAAILRRADKHMEKIKKQGLNRLLREVMDEDKGEDKGQGR